MSGQIGWDPVERTITTGDFTEQTRRALENVIAVLRAAGAEPGHVVRLTWYVTDREEYMAARRGIAPIFRALFGGHYPAMSVVEVKGLLEPSAEVEIEATAVVPNAQSE